MSYVLVCDDVMKQGGLRPKDRFIEPTKAEANRAAWAANNSQGWASPYWYPVDAHDPRLRGSFGP